MQTLKDKKVIITGGSSGIGKEIAKLFVKEGASVAIIGSNLERLLDSLSEIVANRVDEEQKVISKVANVALLKDVEKAIAEILGEFGKVDVLVNNAGITKDDFLLKMSEEEWDEVIDVNLKSVFNTCKSIIRSMMKERGGKIINISSVIGITGNAGQINYAASKAGIIGFSKSLAKEVASRNILVNCIAPGYIETKMTAKLSEQVRDSILVKIPLQRIGRAVDVANTALFLASEAANYITGQVIVVDGGMVM